MTVEEQIRTTAARLGVPPDLAVALAWRESGFNQSARGAAGEIGVFQLMPGTASDVGVNPFDLTGNIEGGIRYLKQQYDRFGNWETALWAYNAGAGNVSKGNVPASTRSYAGDILDKAGELWDAGATWVVNVTEGNWMPSFSLPAAADTDKLLIGAVIIGAISLALVVRR
jgi:soluble lytic murein transglycosylase-like protein